ncbi:PucR family transcriptional regulator [Streptomyces sp. NRRL B-24484]|uniref:PucR family transcriptional regulator n=1 Tax=Streptomyces sp. NRRL B-24484 TaxID=1463833 RepID=UPI0004BF9839|nr:helix-turn-helix domain-containing protein [Streptomyces sp. NRRL B-24484]
MSDAEQWGRPEPEQTLEGLLALVGERFVELCAAPLGVGAAVGRVVVLDPLEQREAPGDLLVAVGVDPNSEEAVAVVRRSGNAGAAGVVLRPAGTAIRTEALREAAAEAGTAVLFRGWWTDWPTVIGMLHAGLSVAKEPAVAGVPLGDLDELARAVALQVRGSVTIEDLDSNVLAHSPTGRGTDEVRVRTILGGRPPQGRRHDMEKAGFFRQLWKSTDVLYRETDGETPERLIVLVRAGDVPLGSIWVAADGEPLDVPAATRALRAAARVAAAHLLHDRARRDGRDQQLVEAARALLDGRSSAALLAERTGLPLAEPCAVLSVRAGTGDRGTAGGGAAVRTRLSQLVYRYCTVRDHAPVVVPSERGVLVLLGGLDADPDKAQARVVRLSRSLAQPLAEEVKLPVRIGIGEVRERLDLAADSRRTAELALSGLLFGHAPLDCARVGDVADAVALAHYLDALRGERPPVTTPVDRLVEKGDTALLDTLRAYLDHAREKARAADALGVPRTTFAHRLDQTVVKASGIDLDDPDARLLAQLQLRLLRRSTEDGA